MNHRPAQSRFHLRPAAQSEVRAEACVAGGRRKNAQARRALGPALRLRGAFGRAQSSPPVLQVGNCTPSTVAVYSKAHSRALTGLTRSPLKTNFTVPRVELRDSSFS